MADQSLCPLQSFLDFGEMSKMSGQQCGGMVDEGQGMR